MPYDEVLARRVRTALKDEPDISERKMFGGIAFMAGDNMCVGVTNDDLMARVGAEQHAAAMARPGVRPMDFTGRPMKGFIFVSGDQLTDHVLRTWVKECLSYVRSLPPKKARKASPRGSKSV